MSLLRAIQESELVYRLGWTLIHSLWLGVAAAALLALVLLGLRRRSPVARYSVACGTMAVLLAAIVAAFLLVQMPKSETGPQAVERTAAGFSPGEAAPPTPGVAALPSTSSSGARTTTAPMSARMAPAIPWICLAWLVGLMVMTVRRVAAWMAAVRIRQLATVPGDAALAEKVASLAKTLGVRRLVCVLESMIVKVPMVIGWLRPAILLPVNFVTAVPADQLEALLLHELAHIRRLDYLVNLLQTLAETLLFYHPAVWFISRQIRCEREHCCDDVALAACREPEVYADALVTAAEASSARMRMAVAADGGRLLSRIRRVLGLSQQKPVRAALLPAAVAMVLLAAMIAVPLFGSPWGADRAAWRIAPTSQLAEAPTTQPVEDWMITALARALIEKAPAEWGVSGVQRGALPLWNWDPPEANGLLIELMLHDPLKADRGKPLEIRLWILEPGFDGTRPDVGTGWETGTPRDFTTWRGRRVLIFGDGSATRWGTYELDIKAAFETAELPKNSAVVQWLLRNLGRRAP